MLAEIFPDETLDSFLSRSIVLSQVVGSSQFHRSLNFPFSPEWSLGKARLLSSHMEGPSSYVFNRLVYRHTGYFASVFIRSATTFDEEVELFRKRNLSVFRSFVDSGSVKVCPQCILDDFSADSVPYWRRSHQFFDVKVCAFHKVLLTSSCPGCNKGFAVRCHYFGGLWSSCECGWESQFFQPVIAEISIDVDYANLVNDIYEFGFLLYDEDVVDILKSEIEERGFDLKAPSCALEIFDYYRLDIKVEDESMFKTLFCNLVSTPLRDKGWKLDGVTGAKVIFLMFRKFSVFLEKIAIKGVLKVPLTSFWNRI
jgi:hypothetical protein